MLKRNVNIKKCDAIVLITEVAIIFITVVVVRYKHNDDSWENYIFLSRLGTIICIVLSLFLIFIQKSIFNITILVFLSFWIFQFGLPVCYAIYKDYSSFYINLFSNEILIKGGYYSIVSIEVFALAITLSLLWPRKSYKCLFVEKKWTNDVNFVSKAAMIMFVATSFVMIPLMFYAAYATKAYGFFTSDMRSYVSSNALYRAVQAFCVPSGILTLVFSNSKNTKKIVSLILFAISLFQLIAGDRTNGLSCLVVLSYFIFFGYLSSRKERNRRQIIYGLTLLLLLVVLVYVAKARVSTSHVSLLEVFSKGIIDSFLSELQFNFTTICFVMTYIPGIYGYKMGSTYLNALLCIIPKSLDPTGWISSLYSNVPEKWLFTINHEHYGSLLDFGVGFSAIGESYMNFSWYGLVIIFLLGFFIMRFLSTDFWSCTKWGKYMQLVLLMYLMTFSRRGFYDLIKNIEYSIFVMALYLWLMQLVIGLARKRGN